MASHTGLRSRNSGLLVLLVTACCVSLHGQTAITKPQIPDAPQIPLMQLARQSTTPMPERMNEPSPQQSESVAPGPQPRLTLADAEKMAIKNNPRVSVARLVALAQHQVVRATRSAELPNGVASVTAEEAENASRISAGS